jgi:hypothetical protein
VRRGRRAPRPPAPGLLGTNQLPRGHECRRLHCGARAAQG